MAEVKHNLQLAEDAPIARELAAIVVTALERHPLFLGAALPHRIYPPMFNRYDGATGMQFGTHVDGAVRLVSRSAPMSPHCSCPRPRPTTAASS
jgi:PKHD-type hydroxylase